MGEAPRLPGRCLCIVTGASRGLGRALAVSLAASLQPGSRLLLVARSGQALRELGSLAAAATGLLVGLVEADLSGEPGLRSVLRAASEAQESDGAPERLLMVHNAEGSGELAMGEAPRLPGRCLCIVTGASRGLGRALAVSLAASLQPGSRLLLVARSGQALRELGSLAAAATGLLVGLVEADLSGEPGLRSVLRAASEAQESDGAPERLLMVHNAATLGDVSKYVVDFSQPSEVTSYMDLNFTSPLCLTALLLKQFPSRENFQRTVINISSLCATKPFKSWSLYCAGKAARDMAFRVLAAEEPDVRVLNYAPGPLDTGMHEQARTETRDPELRKIFQTMHQQGQLLECQESVRKLMDILVRDEFESGAHIDYFDQ